MRPGPPTKSLLDSIGWVWGVSVAAYVFGLVGLLEMPFGTFLLAAFATAMFYIAVAELVGIFFRRFRFDSITDLIISLALSGMVGVAAFIFALSMQLPPEVFLLLIFSLLLQFVHVGLWRLLGRYLKTHRRNSDVNIVVYGAGDAGYQTIRMLHSETSQRFRVMFFLDDDSTKWGSLVEGARVIGGLESLSAALKQQHVDRLLVAITAVSSEKLRAIKRELDLVGIPMTVIPSASDIVFGKWFDRNSQSDSAKLSDLLGRREVSVDKAKLVNLLRDKRVLVTGAGGSIGSELVWQLSGLGVSKLGMIDMSENGLHETVVRVWGRGIEPKDEIFLVDIRDRESLEDVFSEFGPEVVFHTAALKHVKFLERFPEQARKTNIEGTKNIVSLSAAHRVELLVNISTDKAADPTSILGTSKLEAEQFVQNYNRTHGKRSSARFVSVRFGNVLGSRGSVAGIFEHQIRSGIPMSVSHPEAARYFMTIPEAVKLVLESARIGRDGDVLVLDMGEPIRIADLARAFARAFGKESEIVFTELSPGEKVAEVLLSREEDLVPTEHPKISRIEKRAV